MSSETHIHATPHGEEPPVIEVKNLVKEYRLGALEGLRTLGRRMLGRPVPPRQRFRALDDVSLSIRRGEVIGIIGHNGAGKSTLLKLLCRITKPTSGTINVKGRIAPLIEVGAGLVGDMTGRENIYLNATILGLTRAEIDAKVDEIIEFSELEQFIDTPIKRYSSGMQVRLGFAIATAVVSDILIVDEVLAVGDISFQQKCIDRMEALIKRQDKTVIIVGHNIRQLQRVCTRLIMLTSGCIEADSDPSTVSALYFSKAESQKIKNFSEFTSLIQTNESAGFIKVVSISINCAESTEDGHLEMHQPFWVVIEFENARHLETPEFVVGLHTYDFIHLVSVSNASDKDRPSYIPGLHRVRVDIADLTMRPGVYALRFGIVNNYRQVIWYAENIKPVHIYPGLYALALMPESGLIHSDAAWTYISDGMGK